MTAPLRLANRVLIFVGNFITGAGTLALLLGLAGVLSVEELSVGPSSGIRVLAGIAVSGALLSAIGYWWSEVRENAN